MEKYDVPFFRKSNLKLGKSIGYLFLMLLMAGFAILFLFFIMKDDFIIGLLGGLFMLVLSVFIAYFLVTVVILKKFYIEITSEYIKFSSPFKCKIAYWGEIDKAEAYKYNKNVALAILLKKDVNKKRSISSSFNSLVGVPAYSFQIPIMYFNDIDIVKLSLTVEDQINNSEAVQKDNDDILNENSEKQDNNMGKAILIALLICAISSIIYGLSIYKLEKNYMVIPVFTSMLIISGFNKYYIEKIFNINIRILLGLICLIQVPIAVIIAAIVSLGLDFTASNMVSVIIEYFRYTTSNPLSQIGIIIVAIVCFSIGAFTGRTSK
ncbi:MULTISPECIES: hypothetical protein [Clostridium]|uniref:hypothetical protein n=1 Tax=Clostridium TaxID=1485 RepID=UPI0008240B85|nr:MULTISPECIES: hypothetical protein [Clostridium]PJI08067.1 hypothetical protein CUB90_09350 [Clostridium sp. CT7]